MYYTCIDCMEPILPGEDCYETQAGPIHRDCAEDKDEHAIQGRMTKAIRDEYLNEPLKPPTPPVGLTPFNLLNQAKDDNIIEAKQSESMEIVLLEYEDKDVSFAISFDYVFTQTQKKKVPK